MARQLIRFYTTQNPKPQAGILQDDGIIRFIAAFDQPDTETGETLVMDNVKLLTPLPAVPSKIIAVGLNYAKHIQEMKHQEVPDDPVLFLKAPSAIVACGAPIIGRPEWGQIDYEGEIAVVIGKPCKDCTEERALDYVLGYTLANDVTARTLQRQDKQWGRAKNFDTFCPVGPALLLNEGQDPALLALETFVDGQQVQQAMASDMRFSIPFLVSYISRIMTLNPGDVILTGTPEGVGPLRHGQVVRISSPLIGVLENPYQLVGETAHAG